MDINQYLKDKQAQVDRAITEYLPAEDVRPSLLHEAMRYSVLNGGKRIRPILCIAAAEALGKTVDEVMKAAASVEMYHCSTLIHDDLPCMDDDDLRRGQPTCHIKFGEANAVLAGDALMIFAFELLAEDGNAHLGLELARAAGSRGVIAGQVEDLAAEGQKPNADLVEFIHVHKTALLIKASVRMGAIAAGASEQELEKLSTFGEKIGLAFQIADDLLDVEGDETKAGKALRKDEGQGKQTFVTLMGRDAARAQAEILVEQAGQHLASHGADATLLVELARFIVKRDH